MHNAAAERDGIRHAEAWRPGSLGFKVINERATRALVSFFTDPIRQWAAPDGGLGTETIYLSGPELMGIYRQCR